MQRKIFRFFSKLSKKKTTKNLDMAETTKRAREEEHQPDAHPAIQKTKVTAPVGQRKDVYIIISFCVQDIGETESFAVPAHLVNENTLLALRLHNREVCDPTHGEASFRRACKLIAYKLEDFQKYKIPETEPLVDKNHNVLGVFWISSSTD